MGRDAPLALGPSPELAGLGRRRTRVVTVFQGASRELPLAVDAAELVVVPPTYGPCVDLSVLFELLLHGAHVDVARGLVALDVDHEVEELVISRIEGGVT